MVDVHSTRVARMFSASDDKRNLKIAGPSKVQICASTHATCRYSSTGSNLLCTTSQQKETCRIPALPTYPDTANEDLRIAPLPH